MPKSARRHLARWCVAALILAGCSAPPARVPGADTGKFSTPLIIPPELHLTGTYGNDPLYRLTMIPAHLRLHEAWSPTAVWTFNGVFPGPTINVREHQRVFVEYTSELPAEPPFDWTVGPETLDAPHMATVPGQTVHLHGADVMGDSDGTPRRGITAGQSVTYRYDNPQRASMQWYHDHIMGRTRHTVLAGLAGLYFIRGADDDRLNVPPEREVPLVVQDRTFSPGGSHFRYPRGWQSQTFGDTPLVNGRVTPHLEVQPATYRLRVLNASNARFYTLSLSGGLPFVLIGTDGGLLDRPVVTPRLTLAPAERADVLVNFEGAAGKDIVLRNDAPAPHPAADPAVPALPELMQFRVGDVAVIDPARIPEVLSDFTLIDPAALSPATRHRTLVLRAFENDAGQTVQYQILNPENGEDVTAKTPAAAGGQFLADHHDPQSLPNALFDHPISRGSSETWSFVNTTGETHPMHAHLVHFQVLDRQLFDVHTYLRTGELRYLAPPEKLIDPTDPSFDPGMLGWKDTVRVEPGYVLRVVVPFSTENTGEFMLHCHILEHEDNDMMRSFYVE